MKYWVSHVQSKSCPTPRQLHSKVHNVLFKQKPVCRGGGGQVRVCHSVYVEVRGQPQLLVYDLSETGCLCCSAAAHTSLTRPKISYLPVGTLRFLTHATTPMFT